MFTVGLASSLSVLGLSATLAGKLFGSVRLPFSIFSVSFLSI